MPLDNAPDHIKLAVDLIEILEANQVDPAIAEQALQIVLKDYQNKLAQAQDLKQPEE